MIPTDKRVNKRRRNERKYESWVDLADGGRRYWIDVPGKRGGIARYLKEVDPQEETLRFWQEILDEQGNLVGLHQKFPVDLGHQRVE